MESPSLSESDQELDINVITYADVVKKGKDVSQYQVQNEDVALEIALKQSIETLRSTTRPVRQRVSNFSSKMSPKLFNAVKV